MIDDQDIELMKAMLIKRGHDSDFGAGNNITYWEAEPIIELFEQLYPAVFSDLQNPMVLL